MQIKFEKLTKKKAKLYINIFGKSGCGKTYTALTLASNLASSNDKVLIIDTEDRAHYYANDFDGVSVFNAKNIKVSDLLLVIQKAQQELGIEAVVIDSLTPFWDAMMEYADNQTSKAHGANWKIPKKTINTMTLALRRCGIHVITTSLGKDKLNDKMEPTGTILPLFERPKFEPYLDIQIVLDKNGIILETNKKLHHDLNDIFQKNTQIDKQWCEKIKNWLGTGADTNETSNINDFINQAKIAENEETQQPQSKTTPVVDIEGEVIFDEKPIKTPEQIQQEIDDRNAKNLKEMNTTPLI
jgi:hypothetical protein